MKDPSLLRERTVLRATLRDHTLTVVSADGRRATARVAPLSSGGYNTVYAVRDARLVVRVSTKPMSPDEQRDYYRELEVQRALSAESLSPEVFAVLHFTPECSFAEVPYARDAQIGVCMVRFDCTLADVLESAERTARVFVEHDGEEALVALFAKAAGVATCVDTKAANVVVRLEPTVAFALIDVDTHFCGVKQRAVPKDPDLAWLEAELKRAAKAPRGKPPVGALVALSLLILCLDAAPIATMGQLRRIALALLHHAPTVMRLVADDEIASLAPAATKGTYAWMGAAESVFRQLEHYTPIRRLAAIESRLELASREGRKSKLLRLCAPDASLFLSAVRAPSSVSRLLDNAKTCDEIRRIVHSAP
jgi:hypothetical protein